MSGVATGVFLSQDEIEKIALDRGLFFQEQKLYTGYFTINVINAEIIWVPTR